MKLSLRRFPSSLRRVSCHPRRKWWLFTGPCLHRFICRLTVFIPMTRIVMFLLPAFHRHLPNTYELLSDCSHANRYHHFNLLLALEGLSFHVFLLLCWMSERRSAHPTEKSVNGLETVTPSVLRPAFFTGPPSHRSLLCSFHQPDRGMPMSFDVKNFSFFSSISSRLSSAFWISTNFIFANSLRNTLCGMICTTSEVSSVPRDMGTSRVLSTVRCCKRFWRMEGPSCHPQFAFESEEQQRAAFCSITQFCTRSCGCAMRFTTSRISSMTRGTTALMSSFTTCSLTSIKYCTPCGTLLPSSFRTEAPSPCQSNFTLLLASSLRPALPPAVSMVNSVSAMLRATFSAQSNCSVMILASLWRVTDVLISCLWGDDTRHPATPVADDTKVDHGSNSAFNSSSFVNASSSPRSKLSQGLILRGLVLSEDTFNSSVLAARFTLLSVSARMLPPIISCVSTVATPFIACAACCSLPSNFLLVLCAGDAPWWTRLRCTSTEDRVHVSDWDPRKLLALCVFSAVSSWPLVFRPHSAAMFELFFQWRILSQSDSQSLWMRDQWGTANVRRMFRCSWRPPRNKNGQVEDIQFVCTCVCLCVWPTTNWRNRPEAFLNEFLGPATTISILTSLLVKHSQKCTHGNRSSQMLWSLHTNEHKQKKQTSRPNRAQSWSRQRWSSPRTPALAASTLTWGEPRAFPSRWQGICAVGAANGQPFLSS